MFPGRQTHRDAGRCVIASSTHPTGSLGAFCLFELRESQHFSTSYGPSVQAMDTQLGARHRRWTPVIHRDRAQRTITADSLDLDQGNHYYPGKKDHHKRVTTENTEGHGKGKSIRILFSVYFGEFRG